MTAQPGRNDPCPCGSGEKYKHCCMNSESWLSSSVQSNVFLVLTLAIGLTFAGVIVSQCGDADRPNCPPGQVWSEAHGHCH